MAINVGYILIGTSSEVTRAVWIPDLIGRGRVEALDTLHSLGLIGSVINVIGTGSLGTVEHQVPRSPGYIAVGSVVNLYIVVRRKGNRVAEWTRRVARAVVGKPCEE